jgi:hypothetical protein
MVRAAGHAKVNDNAPRMAPDALRSSARKNGEAIKRRHTYTIR